MTFWIWPVKTGFSFLYRHIASHVARHRPNAGNGRMKQGTGFAAMDTHVRRIHVQMFMSSTENSSHASLNIG